MRLLLVAPFVACMVAVTVWGSNVIPQGGRFAVRWGESDYGWGPLSKRAGLTLWLGIECAVAAGIAVTTDSTMQLIGAALLLYLLLLHIYAIRRARRTA